MHTWKGLEAGEKEREGEGRPPFQCLLVIPPAHCIPGTLLCSFWNLRLGLPQSGWRNCPTRGLLRESSPQGRKSDPKRPPLLLLLSHFLFFLSPP